jgi:hypothetical protein
LFFLMRNIFNFIDCVILSEGFFERNIFHSWSSLLNLNLMSFNLWGSNNRVSLNNAVNWSWLNNLLNLLRNNGLNNLRLLDNLACLWLLYDLCYNWLLNDLLDVGLLLNLSDIWLLNDWSSSESGG